MPDAHHFEPVIFRLQKRVAALNRIGRAGRGYAIPVRACLTPDGIPAGQIGPAFGKGHNVQIVSVFHHGVADGDIFRSGPGLWIQSEKARIGLVRLEGGFDRARQGRGCVGSASRQALLIK